MILTRLSTLSSPSPPPFSNHTSTQSNDLTIVKPAKCNTRTLLLCRLATLFVLFAALTLILLAVIFPKPNQSLSTFLMTPTHKQFMPITPIAKAPVPSITPSISAFPTSQLYDLVPAVISRKVEEAEDEVKDGQALALDGLGGAGVVTWYGLDGPTVRVGPLLICSKSGDNGEETCTSASRAAYHMAVLPHPLDSALLALPLHPIGPILLLVTALATIIGIFVFTFGWITVPLFQKIRWSARSRLCLRSPPLPMIAETDSIRQLVHSQTTTSRNTNTSECIAPPIAFASLILPAIGMSVAAAVLELQTVHRAYRVWDKEEADALGLMFRLGGLTFLIPLIPFSLALALILAYIPVVISRYTPRTPLRDSGATIIERKDLGGLFGNVAVQDSGVRLTNGSAVFAEVSPKSAKTSSSVAIPAAPAPVPGDRISVFDPEKTIDMSENSARREREKRDSRRSWRNTFGYGIGEAI